MKGSDLMPANLVKAALCVSSMANRGLDWAVQYMFELGKTTRNVADKPLERSDSRRSDANRTTDAKC